MRRLGFRSWRGVWGAAVWTVTTWAGRRWLLTHLAAICLGFWATSQHGETVGFIALVVAAAIAHIATPPPPDDVEDEAEAPASGTPFSFMIPAGQFQGCEAYVWREPRGGGWHVEVNGRSEATGQMAAWDMYADNEDDLVSILTGMGHDLGATGNSG